MIANGILSELPADDRLISECVGSSEFVNRRHLYSFRECSVSPHRFRYLVWLSVLVVIFTEIFSPSRIEASGSHGHSEDGTVYLAGVAAVDITPKYPVRLNGFGGRRRESEGVRQPLWAKALALGTSDEDTVVIITVDTLGIPDDLTERIADRLKSFGLDRSRLAICASHTHSGPMIRNCANTLFGVPIPDDHWARILKYSDELERNLETVAVNALADRRPAAVFHGKGTVGFAMNRRGKGGPVDHDLPLLVVREPDGALRAVFATYACHCVTLSDDMISGDWAGYAMEHIQRRNPGCEALISIGCGADSNPRGGVLGSRADVADSLGMELSEEVQRLLNTPLTPLVGAPHAAIRRISLALSPLPAREEWEKRAEMDNAIGHHARTQLARLDRGESLLTTIDYPVQTVTFGDCLAMVFLPGEVVVDYSVRLKKELDDKRIWIHAYANACPGYVPSERILSEGGYEAGGAMVYYDIPGPYSSGIEDSIVSEVRRQLDPAFLRDDSHAGTDGVAPKSPSDALRSLRTADRFRVELAAAEPLTESPVAIAWGPDGRLWVAEMNDYPQGRPGGMGGQIRCLYDDDGDGRYERSEVFLSGIPFPTGVTVWRNGVLVCAAPDILFAADTNGDGRADQVETLYTGFATHNYQARVNSLEYGLDGWVYGSCGLFGGEITCVRTGEVVSLGQRDFRIEPDSGRLEPASGATQQGRVRNDWGDWFGCNNGAMLMHYPLPAHYLARNPFLRATGTVTGIAAGPDPGRLFSISEPVLFMLSGPPNRPTAACGLGIYRDTLLGQEFAQNTFTCEPVNNLVHRQILEPLDVTFRSRRDDEERDREFLSSADPWFRPVQVRTGPDGALWVVDMYRYVIEHPIWIPPASLARLDTRAGADRGRIYRVLLKDVPARSLPNLNRLQGAELAAQMESGNGTQRDLVQQQIQWTNDREAVAELKSLSRQSPSPEVRLQALSTLGNLGAISADLLAESLRDPSAAVRRQAVRISEPCLMQDASLRDAVAGLVTDPDPQVRLQLAWSAGFLPSGDAAQVLAGLLLTDQVSESIATAVESSLTSSSVLSVLTSLESVSEDSVSRLLPASRERVLRNLATLADSETVRDRFAELCEMLQDSPQPGTLSQLTRFVDAMRKRPHSDIVFVDADVRNKWRTVSQVAEAVISDDAAAESFRRTAVQLISHGPVFGTSHTDLLVQLLSPRTVPSLQVAAVDALGKIHSDEVGRILLSDWNSREPALRNRIIDVLLSRPGWTRSLLTQMQRRDMMPGELDLTRQQQLLNHRDPEIRKTASEVFSPRTDESRQVMISQYAGFLDASGDAVEGRRLFVKHCAACHRLQDAGHQVGPDIAGYAVKPAQSLLLAVLDPNQALDPRYQSWVIVLDDGRTITGIIAEEAASGITLAAAEGKRESVLRSEVEQIVGTGKSLMPEGFEKHLSPAEMNHLIAYIRSLSLPPKSIEGNHPEIVQMPIDGNVVLEASQAEIYGGDITFELQFRNIGHWHGSGDMVRWRLNGEVPREVAVWAEWACDPGSAGNTFHIEGLPRPLTGKVPSTGAWSRYQLVNLGRTIIPGGPSEIVMRPDPGLKAALVDLRALHLVSIGGVPLATGMVARPDRSGAEGRNREVAAMILDSEKATPEREALIAANLHRAAELIQEMTIGLPADSGSSEEYRRIPWIWRVAIAAGRSGDDDSIRRVLKASLPSENEPLEHWQAVVIGGGLINGLSLSGKWPEKHIRDLIAEDRALSALWQRSLQLSVAMADDAGVPHGTRYDALRMIAMLPWQDVRSVFERYMMKGVHDELQMGAVSGLSDVIEADISDLLINSFSHLSAHNQKLALQAMVRTPDRCQKLLSAIESSVIPVAVKQNEHVQSMLEHENHEVRLMAVRVLAE